MDVLSFPWKPHIKHKENNFCKQDVEFSKFFGQNKALNKMTILTVQTKLAELYDGNENCDSNQKA